METKKLNKILIEPKNKSTNAISTYPQQNADYQVINVVSVNTQTRGNGGTVNDKTLYVKPSIFCYP